MKQQHSSAFCCAHSFQDCRDWWPTSTSTELDNLVGQEHTIWLPSNTHSSLPAANLVLSVGRRMTVWWGCFELFWVSLEKVVTSSQGVCLTNFQAHSPQSPGDQNQPALPENHSSSSFPAEMSSKPSTQNGPACGSALLSYGPSDLVGKQVQIDYLWDKCLLKEQGKATGNYFTSWSGEKNIVTGLESGRAQWHMWAHGMSMDLGFSKTCETLKFSGVHTLTVTYTEKGRLSTGAWLIPRGATSKHCLTSALLLTAPGALWKEEFYLHF